MSEVCDLCKKNPKENFRICGVCAKTHDSTTLDKLATDKRKKTYGWR